MRTSKIRFVIRRSPVQLRQPAPTHPYLITTAYKVLTINVHDVCLGLGVTPV